MWRRFWPKFNFTIYTMIPKLLFDIAKCNNFLSLIRTANTAHQCHNIVDFQRGNGAASINDFQLPEPWSGDILNAPILFISSNPAYSENEIFPTSSWPDTMIADFFINRFTDRGPDYSWVYKNKILCKDGTRGRSVNYWTNINKRAAELLNRRAIPGVDYCLTELVHCKSTDEDGVYKALPECTMKFVTGKLSICGALFIIGIGSHVEKYFGKISTLNGIPIIYLPAPSAFVKHHTFAGNFKASELTKVRHFVSNNKKRILNTDLIDIYLPHLDAVKAFIDANLIGIK
jgi:hypothetical protein